MYLLNYLLAVRYLNIMRLLGNPVRSSFRSCRDLSLGCGSYVAF